MVRNGDTHMFNIAAITRNEFTTDVLFADGTVANVFIINMLRREPQDEAMKVVASCAHTDFNEWLKTLQACIENSLSLAEGNVVYVDQTCLHTTRGGVSISHWHEPALERNLAKRERAWQRQVARALEQA